MSCSALLAAASAAAAALRRLATIGSTLSLAVAAVASTDLAVASADCAALRRLRTIGSAFCPAIRSEERRVGKECRSRWGRSDETNSRTEDGCDRHVYVATRES